MRFKLECDEKNIKQRRKTVSVEVPDKQTYKWDEDSYWEECFSNLAMELGDNITKYFDVFEDDFSVVAKAGKISSRLNIEAEFCDRCGMHADVTVGDIEELEGK